MRIKELLARFRNRGDPCPDVGIDLEQVAEIAGEETEIFENIYLNQSLCLSLVLVSRKGVFVVIPYRDKPDTGRGRKVRRLLGISAVNSLIIYHDGADTFILSWDGMEATPAGGLYALIRDFYRETQGFSEEGWQGFRMLDCNSADRICEMLAAMENSDKENAEPGEIADEDGRVYVKRYESIGFGPIDTGLAGRQRWFPVADMNTDVLVLKAAFGGWFGLHRFSQGEIGTGLLYNITCGCVGILPAIDILSYLTGSMYFYRVTYSDGQNVLRHKEKVYLRKPIHKGLAIAGIFISLLVGAAAWKVLYQGLGVAIFGLLADAAGNAGENAPANIAEWMRIITEGFSWRGGL